ncbi:hypothetical protein TOPH_02285 [Tolypocladium ophioglossoides CBS 100239]|uniref:Uncharacterized protein n=1 Tax=Tolypocladium ophioglossoides (strain CBS 100239) TaxID=1163406 RepID=A0A0L0NGC9_TOLOC|nr:hypothetical protein TOPH_02285 [Tolypocladium ophioglossoides CBS 100239]
MARWSWRTGPLSTKSSPSSWSASRSTASRTSTRCSRTTPSSSTPRSASTAASTSTKSVYGASTARAGRTGGRTAASFSIYKACGRGCLTNARHVTAMRLPDTRNGTRASVEYQRPHQQPWFIYEVLRASPVKPPCHRTCKYPTRASHLILGAKCRARRNKAASYSAQRRATLSQPDHHLSSTAPPQQGSRDSTHPEILP